MWLLFVLQPIIKSISMEFRNVVFNAARDGKLRRLKVRKTGKFVSLSHIVLSQPNTKLQKIFLTQMKLGRTVDYRIRLDTSLCWARKGCCYYTTYCCFWCRQFWQGFLLDQFSSFTNIWFSIDQTKPRTQTVNFLCIHTVQQHTGTYLQTFFFLMFLISIFCTSSS